jgi:ATP-binding cassette subfamily B (MDR/TAP) protein 1
MDTDESRGALCPMITGAVNFKDVKFSYPERSDVPILKNMSMTR